MKKRVMLLLALAIGLAVTVALAQATKRTQTAVITADDLVYDWETDIFEFTGNCRVQISGPDEATMTAPKMIVELNEKADRVKILRTVGKTHFSVLTAPNNKGQRRRIEASSNNGATYNETTQKVVLSGGAVADMTMVPPDERVHAVHFKGERITADLNTKQIKVSQAHMEVTGDVEQ